MGVFINLPFIFILKQVYPNKATQDIAATISGVLGPLLGFFGSALVFKALIEQVKANRIIQYQFDIQMQDQLFYRLMDSLQNRVVNYSINSFEGENKSYKILSFLVEKFKIDFSYKCIYFGRHLLAKSPEIICENFYSKIEKEICSKLDFDLSTKFKQELIEIADYNDRWEHLKIYLKNDGAETEEIRDILRAIGSVYFYKTPYEMRYDMYHTLYDDEYKQYGDFLDGYFNNLKYVLLNIDKIKGNQFYVEYIKGNISNYEKTLLFYHIASRDATEEFKFLVKKYKILDDLYLKNSFFIDLLSEKEYENELNNIFHFEI